MKYACLVQRFFEQLEREEPGSQTEMLRKFDCRCFYHRRFRDNTDTVGSDRELEKWEVRQEDETSGDSDGDNNEEGKTEVNQQSLIYEKSSVGKDKRRGGK